MTTLLHAAGFDSCSGARLHEPLAEQVFRLCAIGRSPTRPGPRFAYGRGNVLDRFAPALRCYCAEEAS